jgi:hypothetical protein
MRVLKCLKVIGVIFKKPGRKKVAVTGGEKSLK